VRRFFYKALTIENGFVVVFILFMVIGGATWAAFHFLREDTSVFTSEIERLQNANAALTSKNQELQKVAGAQQAERNQLALIPQFNAERDAAIAERDQAKDALHRLKADGSAVQDRLDQLQQDNRKIKGDLDAAIAERDRLRQSLATVRTTPPPPSLTKPPAPSNDNIPAAWKGPRCIEEARGQRCPDWLPVFGHDYPCQPNETKTNLMGIVEPGKLPGDQVLRPWCIPGKPW
jgi:hypothetical protein